MKIATAFWIVLRVGLSSPALWGRRQRTEMDLKNDPAIQGHEVKIESMLGLGVVLCGLSGCWIPAS